MFITMMTAGPESEPFIIQLYGEEEEEEEDYIITVTDRYILLKDLNGDVMEELDLAGLQVS